MKRSLDIFGITECYPQSHLSYTESLAQYKIYTCTGKGRLPDDPYCSCKNCIMNQSVVLIHTKQWQKIIVYSDVLSQLIYIQFENQVAGSRTECNARLTSHFETRTGHPKSDLHILAETVVAGSTETPCHAGHQVAPVSHATLTVFFGVC